MVLLILKDEKLKKAVKFHNAKNWKKIAKGAFGDTKSDVQCLHRFAHLSVYIMIHQMSLRWQKVLDPTLVKGPWTKEVHIIGVGVCSANVCDYTAWKKPQLRLRRGDTRLTGWRN